MWIIASQRQLGDPRAGVASLQTDHLLGSDVNKDTLIEKILKAKKEFNSPVHKITNEDVSNGVDVVASADMTFPVSNFHLIKFRTLICN